MPVTPLPGSQDHNTKSKHRPTTVPLSREALTVNDKPFLAVFTQAHTQHPAFVPPAASGTTTCYNHAVASEHQYCYIEDCPDAYHPAFVEHVEQSVLLQGHAREGGSGGLHLSTAVWQGVARVTAERQGNCTGKGVQGGAGVQGQGKTGGK